MTFIGMWTEADDHGNGIADERLLKGAIWPLDDDIEPLHVSAFLRVLAASGHIRLYQVGDETYFHIVNFAKHQAAAYRRGDPKFPVESAGQGIDADLAPGCVQESAECTQESALIGNIEHRTGNIDQGGLFAADAASPSLDAVPSAKKSKHALPEDWVPTDKHRQTCSDNNLDLNFQAAKFRAHASANARKQVNWNAAFTQWLLTSIEYRQNNQGDLSRRGTHQTFQNPASDDVYDEAL